MQIQCGKHLLDLSQPRIMGILNVTPDSFYDGGQLYQGASLNFDSTLAKAEALLNSGADIIDVGGESTRPGANAVTEQEECDRVLPVVEALVNRFDALVSVDTSSPGLMLQAASVGAGIINDVRALEREGAVEAVAKSQLPVCLMHMKGQPKSMQDNPSYENAVNEVQQYLLERAKICELAKIPREKILLDPGFGFGKTDQHNLALLESLPDFCKLGYPLLVGISRKSMIGRLLGRELEDRLAGSLALALIALQKGAKILRVHDVAETVDVRNIYQLTSADA